MLSHIIARVERELEEERSGTVSSTQDEPIFQVIQGLPGTGKSKVIAWTRELFTDVLGWERGNQFVCLAVQNTMASNIDGYTIHHWGSISFRDEKGREIGNKGGKRDTSLLFHRCINLRWLLIDEISMVSAELLAELQYLVNQAVRIPHTYKKRQDKTIRPFGGINTLLFGDWWQLRAVRATSLFDRPSTAKSELAYNGLLLIWGQNRNSAQGVWELEEQVRCPDKWFQCFLTECRNGELQFENYFFIHGVPTESPGSAIGSKMPTCGKEKCAGLLAKWKDEFKISTVTGKVLMKDECNTCKKERKARAAVAKQHKEEEKKDERFENDPFVTAPYIHQLNVPKHAANVDRAMRYSEKTNRTVNWITAHDYPLHLDDQAPLLFLFFDTSASCRRETRHLSIVIYIYMYYQMRLWTRREWTRSASTGCSSTTKRPVGSWACARS